MSSVVKRVRQYGEKNKGPFIVCVRAIEKPLLSLKIMKFLRDNYKCNLITKQINEYKMNVIFEPANNNDDNIKIARGYANAFPKSEWGKTYRVYIPERLVETIGCISWSADQEVDDIVKYGGGKFHNTSLPNVDVLDAVRFEKVIEEAGNMPQKISTNTVRVTFDGLLLPEFLNVDGLLIPVREFKRKQMFCELCLKYNHTSSHCNNKPYKSSPNDKKCMHCQNDEHKTGDNLCPKRKFLEKREKGTSKEQQKKTYAEMLQEVDPKGELNNESDKNFQLDLGTRNSRKRQTKEAPKPSCTNSTESPLKKRRHVNVDEESWLEGEEDTPPGLRYAMGNNEEENEITNFIKMFIVELGLPTVVTQLMLKLIIPFVDKIVKQITNSFLEKMSQFSL